MDARELSTFEEEEAEEEEESLSSLSPPPFVPLRSGIRG
jgi:hypothetical protein